MEVQDPIIHNRPQDRRSFLKWSGGAVLGAGLLAEACTQKEDSLRKTTDASVSQGTIVLSADDYGILNYAYALEQLEAAFYVQVVANAAFSSIFSSEEQALITDVRDHEVAHREFFKAALGSNAIQALTPNFSSILFNSRRSVLRSARAFEDLGVSAYNGVGPGIKNADYLTIAGKIVSVEARHAAFFRELYGETTFVENDVINKSYTLNYTVLGRMPIKANAYGPERIGFNAMTENSTEKSKRPVEVLSIAGAYIVEHIDASHVPYE